MAEVVFFKCNFLKYFTEQRNIFGKFNTKKAFNKTSSKRYNTVAVLPLISHMILLLLEGCTIYLALLKFVILIFDLSM